MFIKVLSRHEAENLCRHSEEYDNVALISITNSYGPHAKVFTTKGVKNILHLIFDDIDGPDPYLTTMSANQAKMVALFVNALKGEVEGFFVHCEAGISRSAAVAAAIMKYITGDDSAIFENRRYCPNMLCYRLVLEALMKEGENLI